MIRLYLVAELVTLFVFVLSWTRLRAMLVHIQVLFEYSMLHVIKKTSACLI